MTFKSAPESIFANVEHVPTETNSSFFVNGKSNPPSAFVVVVVVIVGVLGGTSRLWTPSGARELCLGLPSFPAWEGGRQGP